MDRQKVKSGLGLMFWGNIVALFAVIPILGVIAALVGGIMELIAIVNLRKQSENYNNAFWFTIIGIVLGLFVGGDGLWGTAMSILHGLATLGATYYICTATEECVSIVSYEVADYCHSVCNWYVTCMVISLAISAAIFVFSIIPILGFIVAAIGSLALIVVAIFQLIESIRFLIMLWKCQGVLKRGLACSGCDNLGGDSVEAFYEPYINGENELRQLNEEYVSNSGMVR